MHEQSDRSSRKAQHIEWAVRLHCDEPRVFSDIHLVHDSLADYDTAAIDTATKLGALQLKWPVIVGAITGGCPEGERVNASLARVSAAHGLPLAVGSQRAALDDARTRHSFEVVRKYDPDGLVFGNLSAACTPTEARDAVAMIGADALQLHLNGMQELLMPEGERQMSALLSSIGAIVEALPVPVFVKEVGFGMTGRTAKLLEEVGVAAIDIAGHGGTSFASIEAHRAGSSGRRDAFADWGLPTAVSLAEVLASVARMDVIAGGGVRDGHDILKSLVMGACAASVSGEFLATLINAGEEALFQEVDSVKAELLAGMGALGATSVADLRSVEYVVTGESALWLGQRGVPLGRNRDATIT